MSVDNNNDFLIENGVLKKYTGAGGAVVIPAGVTSIGERAFEFCRSMTAVTVPEGVTSIGLSAFAGCRALSAVSLPGSLEDIGEFAFFDCAIRDLPAAPGLTRLQRSAFSKCRRLTQVTLYGGLACLERGVFFGCVNLTDVTLPLGMSEVSKSAFLDCNRLMRIHAHPDSPYFRDVDGLLCDKAGDRLLICPNGLADVTVPESVTAIGMEAFADGMLLERVTLPGGLREIGESAFKGCFKLAELLLPEGPERLDEAALEGCRALTSLYMPDSLRSIGWGAFQKCPALRWIRLHGDVAFDLHWFVNAHDPDCRSADHTTVPFVTTRHVSDIKSELGKRRAALGFIFADLAGVSCAADVREGYMDYIRLNLALFHTELLTDMEILQWLTDHGMIARSAIEGLLVLAAEGGHTAASAALLDYQNKTFAPKNQAVQIDMRFEELEDALSL